MADELFIEDSFGTEITHTGDEQTLPQLYNLVKGVPSATQTFNLRNASEDKLFEGVIYAVPLEGRSYSSDVQVAANLDSGGAWGSTAKVLIPPEETVIIHVRIVARLTPEDSAGRAAVVADGDFFVYGT